MHIERAWIDGDLTTIQLTKKSMSGQWAGFDKKS